METLGALVPPAEYLGDDDRAREFLTHTERCPYMAIDTETDGTDIMQSQPVFFSLAAGGRRACVPALLLPLFEPLFTNDRIKVFHNAKFDLHALRNCPHIRFDPHGPFVDTAVMSLRENSARPNHDLKYLASDGLFVRSDPRYNRYPSFVELFGARGGRKKPDYLSALLNPENRTLVSSYASLDAWSTLVVFEELKTRLENTPANVEGSLWDLYMALEARLTPVLWEYERTGFPVDAERLMRSREPIEREIEKLVRRIAYLAGSPINPNSTPQLMDLFVKHLGLPIVSYTDGGKSGARKPSVDESVLLHWRGAAPEHAELIQAVLDYRGLLKIKSTYIDGLLKAMDPMGRVHAVYNQGVARTGRLCVSGTTKLETDHGTITISDPKLTNGTTYRVLSHKGKWRRILGVVEKEMEEMVELRTTRGSSIVCTKGHRILAPSGWKRVGDIQLGESVLISSPRNGVSPLVHRRSEGRLREFRASDGTDTSFLELDTVASINSHGVEAVWDIIVEEDHSYIAGGLVHHNSSARPNLQNIPAHPDRFGIREAFAAPPGHVVVDIDYEQIEMRLAACLANDERMIDAILGGKDIHSMTVSFADGIDYELVHGAKAARERTPEQARLVELRERRKRTGFGILFGQTEYGLSRELGCDRETASGLIRSWLESWPGVHKYIRNVHAWIQEHGWSSTVLGWRRQFPMGKLRGEWDTPERHDRDWKFQEAMRAGMNHGIQGSAADILKLALIACHEDTTLRDLGMVISLTVHDEIIGIVPEANAQAALARCSELASDPLPRFFDIETAVPITASGDIGRNWAEAKR